MIVYFIVSPSSAYPNSALSTSAVFSLDIIGSTYLFSVSFVFGSSESPTVAWFLIIVPSSISFTVTSKLTSAVFPAGTSTSIPWFNSVSKYVFSVFIWLLSTFTTILPGTNVVPVGALSFTIVVADAVPSLFKLTLYVIFSPSTT